MVQPESLVAAIESYNEYRHPMATATVVDHTGRTFAVRFRGPFCRMCCDYDYFEDLIYELATRGEDPEEIGITDIEYEGAESFLVGFASSG